MNMNNNIFFKTLPALAALFLLAACTQDEPGSPAWEAEGAYPLQIGSVSITAESSEEPWSADAPQTRIIENPDDGSWSEWVGGDQFSIQIDGGSSTGKYLVETSGTITALEPVYWQSKEPKKIRAWFPHDAMADLRLQTSVIRLAYMLHAETEEVDYATPDITLPFKNRLAKVRVLLNGNVQDVTKVEVFNYEMAKMDKQTGEVSPIFPDEKAWINMMKCSYKNVSNCWEANVVPEEVNGTNLIRLNGTSVANITFESGATTTKFEAGKMYTLNVEVKSSVPADL